MTLPVVQSDDSVWILKLPGRGFADLVHAESSTMNWCRAAGFDVPETFVVPREAFPSGLRDLPDVTSGFLIRRYDRVETGRIHQEDFAQVLCVRPEAKYGATDAVGLGRFVWSILGADGVAEYVRRLVFVVAAGNADAHLKNWSLIYPDGVRAQWSPVYDQVATIAFEDIETRLAMRIGNAHYLRQVGAEHLVWLAGRLGVAESEAQALIDEVLERLRATFDPEALGMPHRVVGKLRAYWDAVPLLRPYRLP